MDRPLVSIVIPVYNGENYIGSAIDSVLRQTYQNIELIIVDDGSNDNTENIVKSYGSRVRYIKKQNGGVASAVNVGVSAMKGSYFAWLSHDDIFHPEKISRQMDAFAENNYRECVCFSNIDVLHLPENRLVHEDYLESYLEEQITNSCFSAVFFTVHGSTILVPRSLINKVGLWDEMLPTTQDSVWLFKAMRGRQNIFIRDSLVTVRIHPRMGQLTIKEHEHEFNDMVRLFCESLTKTEKTKMYGSEKLFYLHLYQILKGREKSKECLDYLASKIELLHEETDATTYYTSLFGTKKMDIAIFGRGTFGKIVFDTFEIYHVKVSCFFDNNNDNVGKYYKGCECRSIDYLISNKDNLIVIASISNPEIIMTQLEKMNVKNAISKDEALNILYKVGYKTI